jgi:hypothetical protein
LISFVSPSGGTDPVGSAAPNRAPQVLQPVAAAVTGEPQTSHWRSLAWVTAPFSIVSSNVLPRWQRGVRSVGITVPHRRHSTQPTSRDKTDVNRRGAGFKVRRQNSADHGLQA